MRRSGFVALVICSLLTLASVTGWSAPTDAHDIYMALKNRFGQSCCNEGDCRPAHCNGHADAVVSSISDCNANLSVRVGA